MKKEDQKNQENTADRNSRPQTEKGQRSSAFREPNPRDEKSTTNIEEANLEQDRKEAMRERD